MQSLKQAAAEFDKEKLQNGGGSSDDMNGELNTILKLSSKLQEVIRMNETVTQSKNNLTQVRSSTTFTVK